MFAVISLRFIIRTRSLLSPSRQPPIVLIAAYFLVIELSQIVGEVREERAALKERRGAERQALAAQAAAETQAEAVAAAEAGALMAAGTVVGYKSVNVGDFPASRYEDLPTRLGGSSREASREASRLDFTSILGHADEQHSALQLTPPTTVLSLVLGGAFDWPLSVFIGFVSYFSDPWNNLQV